MIIRQIVIATVNIDHRQYLLWLIKKGVPRGTPFLFTQFFIEIISFFQRKTLYVFVYHHLIRSWFLS